MKKLLPLLLLLTFSSAFGSIYMTNDKPFNVLVFMWKSNSPSGYDTLIQATNLPPSGTNKFTSNDLYDGVGVSDTNRNFAAQLRLFPLKAGDVAIHSVGNGGSKLSFFRTNSGAFRLVALTNAYKTNPVPHIHSYTYITNRQFLVTSTAGDFGISNKTFTLNRNTFLWTNAFGYIGTNYAVITITNVLVTHGGLTNYGSSFTWNPNWTYLGFQNENLTGAWTNSVTKYFIGSDENGTYIDIGCSSGAQNPIDCDGAENEDYVDLHGGTYFSGGANDVTNGWSLGSMTFLLQTNLNGVKITSTARGGNVIYSNSASILSSFVVATNVLATPAPTVSYKVTTYTNF